MTVTVYVPVGALFTELLPPQPLSATAPKLSVVTRNAENRTGIRRRRENAHANAARLTTPAERGHGEDPRRASSFFTAALLVVPITRVDVAVPPAVRLMLAGVGVQVAFAGNPEQLRVTVPL